MALTYNDITEIQQVQALYGHAVDHSDQSLLLKVFTKDAIFDGRRAGDAKSYYDSLPVIMAWFGEGKPPHPLVHNMFNVYVYEEGGQVRVKAKWMVRSIKDKNIYMGDYEDIMERTPDGWRIKLRICIARDPGPLPTGRT